MERVQRHTELQGVPELEQAIGAGSAQRLEQRRLVQAAPGVAELEPVRLDLQAAHPLLQRLGEGAADRHHLAHRLHLRGEGGVGLGKLLEGEARDLDHAVVDGRLEAGGGLARDVVGYLVQGVADGELGRELGDRESGRLGGERGGARQARVHLDDHHAAGGRIERELDVGAAGLHPHLADAGDGGVAHDLIFAVGQGLRRRHGDRIAGVHAHRIDVFDRADDDDVVLLVAHHFQLELLPADHRLLDQDLVGQGELQPLPDDPFELRRRARHAAAGAAQGEAGAHDAGKAGRRYRLAGRLQAAGDRRLRHGQADLLHGAAEVLPPLGHLDGGQIGADHLHAEPLEQAGLRRLDRQVERGLAAQGGEHGVRPLPLQDALQRPQVDRLHVGAVGHLRIGHDGGRVGVEQHHLEPFLLERLARLRAGIVELARLADHDRPGAEHQDSVDIRSLGHYRDLMKSDMERGCS